MPKLYKATEETIFALYVDAFSGHISYALKDKDPQSLAQAKAFATTIELNLTTSKIDLLSYP